MITDPLFSRQTARWTQAQQILRELCLMERWQAYGQPILVGAVAYELVVNPDLDMEIYCPGDPRIADGFAILEACAQHPRVTQASFSNRLNTPDQGYYWQLRYLAEDGVEWKVDMWSVRFDHPGPTSRDFVAPMRRALTPETRRAILEIKERMLADSALRTISMRIYQAVLEGGSRTFEQFAAWHAAHPDPGLVWWQP